MLDRAIAWLIALIHHAEFWLSILPPVLAILVENFNPISGKVVRANTERDLVVRFQRLEADDRAALLDTLEKSGAAIGEISGLAPTLIASITSGFALLHEIASPFWPAVIYVLIFIVVALYLLWLLSGLTFADIGGQDAAIPTPWGEIPIEHKRTAVVSFTIYVANGLLIVLAIFVFSWRDEVAVTVLPAGNRYASPPLSNLKAVGHAVEPPAARHPYSLNSRMIEFRFDDLQRQIDYKRDELADLARGFAPLASPPASEFLLGPVGWQRVQQALYRLGFDPGGIDGIPGPKTRIAIRNFQRAEGNRTTVDGRLTADQIAKLWSKAQRL